jgi:PAS domain S-box-containing protein
MSPVSPELILDRAYSAVVSMDEEGLVTYWNPSAESTFGIPRSEAVGRPVAELVIPKALRAAHRAGLERFLADGTGPVLDRSVEMTALRSDGSEFPAELTITALRDGERWTFHAFVRDISALRESERDRELLVGQLQRSLHGSQRRFEAIVGELSDPVTIRDREHGFLYANRAALSHLGFESSEELRRTDPSQLMAEYLVWDEHGNEVSMSDIPSVRILRGEPAQPLLIRTVDRNSGAQRWNLLKAAPLLDDAGAVEATITIIEDVTDQKRAEWHGAFLAEVSDVLASSLDYEQTLRNVARLTVPDIADWCAVDLFDEEGDRQPVAVAHRNPDRLKLAEELRRYERERPDPTQGLGLVFHTGESLLYEDITDEMLVAAAVDDRDLELLRAVGFRSAAIVPMRLGPRTLGAMTLVSAESRRTLDRLDLALAQQVASRAAVAIENSRLYTERSGIAHTLQQSLLPDQLPEIPGYELASMYIPALESTEVGGDFYDVWQTKDSWMIVVGDVTGKGVGAATLTSLVRHTIRAASDFELSPSALLARVDATLKRQRRRSICTALCIRLNDEQGTIAVGGHPLPLLVSADGVTEIGAHGPLLGGFEDVRWRDASFDLEPGSALVSYTDGVTDAVDRNGARYGLGRLKATFTTCAERVASKLVETLGRSLSDFQAGPHADDTAVLVLSRQEHVPTYARANPSGPQETGIYPDVLQDGVADGSTDKV